MWKPSFCISPTMTDWIYTNPTDTMYELLLQMYFPSLMISSKSAIAKRIFISELNRKCFLPQFKMLAQAEIQDHQKINETPPITSSIRMRDETQHCSAYYTDEIKVYTHFASSSKLSHIKRTYRKMRRCYIHSYVCFYISW